MVDSIGFAEKTLKRAPLTVLLIIAVLAAGTPGAADRIYGLLGKAAPSFRILSGDDKTLLSDGLMGKVAVIFYETREASRKNSDIKDRFNVLYDRQNEETRHSILRIPVFNCSNVIWPVSTVWKQSLRSHSKRVGITLYADWDGRMASDYQMKDNESNLVIVDRKGIIRYASVGRITDQQFLEIEELLDRLVNREK